MNILISTLGTSWNIIPETIGFTNYSKLDFYMNHPNLLAISKVREIELGNTEVDELWLIATDKLHIHNNRGQDFNSTEEDIQAIRNWNVRCGSVVGRIRLWILDGIADITSEVEANQFHDLTLKVVAYAKQMCSGGKLFLSLACGRKTMSADIQNAAYCFGCDAMIHILGDSLKTEVTTTLTKEQCLNIHPLCLGKYSANEVITGYQVPIFQDKDVLKAIPSVSFLEEIKKLQDDAKFFYTSYYLNQTDDNHDNFQILYTLPHEKIEFLKRTRIGIEKDREQEELSYLLRLPKAELHCHLGGVLNCEEIIQVAKCYEEEIQQLLCTNKNFESWYNSLNINDIVIDTKNYKKEIKAKALELDVEKNYLINVAFILKFKGKSELLERLWFGKYIDDTNYRNIDMTPYEALGDLQGSMLLQSEASIRQTIRILLKKAESNNVIYLEVRCSPLNYTSELNASQVLQCILEELEKNCPEMAKSLLIIASRHSDLEKIKESISLMKSMLNKELFIKYFRGFDLAGDERAAKPADLREYFLDILKDCRNITIHAGETMPAESIWEAVYCLNAERIGHGLTLHNNASLINKFLERKIGIEMCPSSNYQIKGFKDNYILESRYEGTYPLKEYLDKELRVCVNTDNPGISRTNFTRELHRAARLTPKGLSLWEILQLLYNGFLMSFYPYNEKKKLIKKAENLIADLIRKEEI